MVVEENEKCSVCGNIARYVIIYVSRKNEYRCENHGNDELGRYKGTFKKMTKEAENET